MTDIHAIIKRTEQEKGIRVLYAAEMGSRTWGWNAQNSDYDVRCIYVRNVYDYFKMSAPDDTVSVSDSSQDVPIDFHGWDLLKYLRLLQRSNPSAVEWMRSPTRYIEEWPTEVLHNLAVEYASPYMLYQHYYGIAIGHYRKYAINNGDSTIDVRKYLHMIRPLLSVQYMQEHQTLAPLAIQDLIHECDMPQHISAYIIEFIKNRDSVGSVLLRNRDVEEYCEQMLLRFKDPVAYIAQNGDTYTRSILTAVLNDIAAECIVDTHFFSLHRS